MTNSSVKNQKKKKSCIGPFVMLLSLVSKEFYKLRCFSEIFKLILLGIFTKVIFKNSQCNGSWASNEYLTKYGPY
jgi:hypothetical protein